MSVKRVYFVRHGQTVGNHGGYFQFSDTPLSEAGIEGAKAVALRFQHLAIDELIASPFTRTQQTASYISEITQKPIVTVKSFHECLQPLVIRGQKFDSEAGLLHIDAYKENYARDSWKPDGAENFFDVLLRVKESIEFLQSSSSENVIVVSHGAFLKSLTAYLLLNKSEDLQSNIAVAFSLKSMSNVGITEFMYEDGTWKLFTWNDHAHFAE